MLPRDGIGAGAPLRAALLALAVVSPACRSLSGDTAAATPQRPTLSADTSTTANSSLELELGGLLLDGGSASTPLTVKYGASDTTELFVGLTPYQRVDVPGTDEDGLGDLSLGVRERVADETDDRPSLAVQAIVKIPTADEDRGLGTGELDLVLAGIATRSLPPWTFTGFGQLDLLGDPAGGVLVGQSLAAAVSRPLEEDFAVFGEIAGVLVPETDSEQLFATLGVTHAPSPARVLDLGVVVGLTEEAPDFGLVLGLTQNLGSIR